MIERALGAPTRIRIIVELWRGGEMNATELAHRLGTNYSQLIEHVELLAACGIVEEKKIGRARLVGLSGSAAVARLAQALVELEGQLACGKPRAGP